MFYCFYYKSQNCTFYATNEPMNFMTSIAQSQAASRNITTGQNFLFWSYHSWKSNRCQKSTAFRMQAICRESLIGRRA